MADGTDMSSGTREPAAARLARILGRPVPTPFTEEEEQAYQAWLAAGDNRVAARRAQVGRRAA
ncbi:hypothetical protein [Actinoplanes sp. URMC 104]|uniref:hypothetical protein n=1 Tax=Actinoplanes sp. URMC 104 TaxID=3423409 RepID=UPI003F1BA0D3